MCAVGLGWSVFVAIKTIYNLVPNLSMVLYEEVILPVRRFQFPPMRDVPIP